MTMPPTPKVPSIVTNQLNNEKLRDDNFKDEIDDSEYQMQWVNVMDQGHYQRPSTYERVEALLLCWADNSDDMATKEEVNKLKSVFEYLFNYNAYIEYLDSNIEQRLQVQINAKVAAFVSAHDGPNTLFIVYYAGHGRPGTYYGSLELFGSVNKVHPLFQLLISTDKAHLMTICRVIKRRRSLIQSCGIRLKSF